MENVRLDPNRTMAIEVLSFDDVELEKTIGSKHSFATIGTLNVLYFKEYSVFLLCLNNWKYVLLHNLPIIKASQNYIEPIVYVLPIDDGFFTLKFTKIAHIEAVQNFEIILGRNCAFKCSYEAQALLRGDVVEQTSREELYSLKENERMSFSNQDSFSTIFSQSGLRKRDVIKRELIRAINMITQELSMKRTENINLTHLRQYDSLINTTEQEAPVHFILRNEVKKKSFFVNVNSG